MDPITVIIVLMLLAAAIKYKDAAAFVVMFILLGIWTAMIAIGLGIAWCVCCAIDGFKLLRNKG